MSYQKKFTRYLLPEIAIAITLAFLLLVSPAYAEGELPPPDAEPASSEPLPAEIEPAASEPLPTDPPSAEEVVLSEPDPLPAEEISEEPLQPESPVDAASPDVQEPAAPVESMEAQPAEAETSNIVDALAETGISVVNENGEVVDFASLEGEQFLSGADPYWTVGTQLYAVVTNSAFCPAGTTFGTTCWVNASPISYALSQINTLNLLPSNGILYVEGGTYNENVTVDGLSGSGILANLKGIVGVNGLSLTTINGNVSISNTVLGFTLSGFTINGRLIIDTNTGTLNLQNLDVNYTATVNYPIYVDNHKGSINVKQVKSSGNREDNYFDNSDGIGNITITQSAFDNNNPSFAGSYAHGLYLVSNGTITLDGVSASNNNGSGVLIFQGGALTIKNSVFNNNYGTPDHFYGGYGVYAAVNKVITVSQVIANNNEHDGLYFSSPMAITLSDVSTINNGKNGVRIDATGGFGAVKVSYGAFIDNNFNGLLIYAKGPVTLTSVFASLNSFSGVYVDNCQWNGSFCDGTGTVTVTSLATKGEGFANAFLNNSQDGLYIVSKGNILVENFTASGNLGTYAVYLDNGYGTGNITVKATLPGWINSMDGNTSGHGLYATSNGAILVDKVHSSNNGLTGMVLTNSSAPTIKPVTLSNSTANGNNYFGINIASRGLVTITNVDAYDHVTAGYDGITIDTTYGSGGVIIKATTGQVNEFYNNDQVGLRIGTYGSVAISDVASNFNGAYGIAITSDPAIGTPTVSLTRVTVDSSVLSTGIFIYAHGPILLTNVTSSNNANGNGADIRNMNSSGTPGVTVKNSVFNNNRFDGLYIWTKGAVLITTITANDNRYSGLAVDNCSWDGSACAGVGGITVSSSNGSVNTFTGNTFSGLSLYSNKNILLTNIRAEYNGDHGIWLSNNWPDSIGNITITATTGKFNTASSNGQDGNGDGVIINSYGIVTVSRLIADSNNGRGMSITNDSAATAKAVTVSDSTFSNNQSDGLYIYSKGLITLRAVESSDNTKSDWDIPISGRTVYDFLSSSHVQDIWRFSGTIGASVNIILESSAFDAYVELRSANGNLILSNDNGFGGTNAQILTTLPFTGDFYLVVTSLTEGANGKYRLTLNDPSHVISTYFYSEYGVFLDNSAGSAGVSILPNASGKGSTFSRNAYYGVYVNTKGAVTFNKVLSEGNGSGGGYLTNNIGPNLPMTFTAVNFNNNDAYGVWIITGGNVSWNGGGASGNATGGAYLDGKYGTTMNTATFSKTSFNYNRGIYNGLTVLVKGTITLNSVNAVGNGSSSVNGAYLDNCLWNGSACVGNGNVIITSLTGSLFNDNTFNGVVISTRGIVQLTNIAANNNGSNGIEVDASNGTGAVTIQNTALSYNNTISGNGIYGLYVRAKGTVTINQLKALDNNNNNLRLVTYTAPILAPIRVSNVAANGSLSATGIFAQSAGAITLNKVVANDNSQNGAYLESGGGLNVLVTSSRFNFNGVRGLDVISDGKITLNAVSANGNSGTGAYLDNDLGSGDVEILSTLGDNHFSFNGANGLIIATAGNVRLNRITSQENAQRGVSFSNTAGSGTVTITTLITKMNGSYGLFFMTDGAAVLSGITSLNNGVGTNSDGLYISSTSALGVSISNSFFLGNEGSGIEADLLSTNLLTLVNTAYWGNDSGGAADLDLSIY